MKNDQGGRLVPVGPPMHAMRRPVAAVTGAALADDPNWTGLRPLQPVPPDPRVTPVGEGPALAPAGDALTPDAAKLARILAEIGALRTLRDSEVLRDIVIDGMTIEDWLEGHGFGVDSSRGFHVFEDGAYDARAGHRNRDVGELGVGGLGLVSYQAGVTGVLSTGGERGMNPLRGSIQTAKPENFPNHLSGSIQMRREGSEGSAGATPDGGGPDGGLDGGVDGGADGGIDGGPDGGIDGGPDAGPDGGPDAPDAPAYVVSDEYDDAGVLTRTLSSGVVIRATSGVVIYDEPAYDPENPNPDANPTLAELGALYRLLGYFHPAMFWGQGGSTNPARVRPPRDDEGNRSGPTLVVGGLDDAPATQRARRAATRQTRAGLRRTVWGGHGPRPVDPTRALNLLAEALRGRA